MIINFFKRLFFKLPLWTHGLECQICRMTLISPEAHLNYATKNKTLSKHRGKIPILRK